jgi:hypothetical protein
MRCSEEYFALGDNELRDWLYLSSNLQVFDPLFPPLIHYPTSNNQLLSYTIIYYCLLLSSFPDTADYHSSHPLLLFDCPPWSIHPLTTWPLCQQPYRLFIPVCPKEGVACTNTTHILTRPPCPTLCASFSLFPLPVLSLGADLYIISNPLDLHT